MQATTVTPWATQARAIFNDVDKSWRTVIKPGQQMNNAGQSPVTILEILIFAEDSARPDEYGTSKV